MIGSTFINHAPPTKRGQPLRLTSFCLRSIAVIDLVGIAARDNVCANYTFGTDCTYYLLAWQDTTSVVCAYSTRRSKSLLFRRRVRVYCPMGKILATKIEPEIGLFFISCQRFLILIHKLFPLRCFSFLLAEQPSIFFTIE